MSTDQLDDERAAVMLVAMLMRRAAGRAPIARIRHLTRLLAILRIVIRVITAERDRQAACATAVYPYRRLAARVGVTPSTMQRWCEAGKPDPVDDAPLHRYACLL